MGKQKKSQKTAVFGVDKETTADLIGQVIPLSHKQRYCSSFCVSAISDGWSAGQQQWK